MLRLMAVLGLKMDLSCSETTKEGVFQLPTILFEHPSVVGGILNPQAARQKHRHDHGAPGIQQGARGPDRRAPGRDRATALIPVHPNLRSEFSDRSKFRATVPQMTLSYAKQLRF